MIKTLLKLALAAFIANALWRVGSEYITEFKFKDAVREAAVYDGKGDVDLRQHISALASQFDLPVDDDAVQIEHTGRLVIVRGTYDKPIELLPGKFYPWTFAWEVEAELVRGKNGVPEGAGDTDGR